MFEEVLTPRAGCHPIRFYYILIYGESQGDYPSIRFMRQTAIFYTQQTDILSQIPREYKVKTFLIETII